MIKFGGEDFRIRPQTRRQILHFVLTGMCFTVVGLLYKLPNLAIVYAWIMAGYINGTFWIMGYIKKKRDIAAIEAIANLPSEAKTLLPASDNAVEKQYQQVLMKVIEESQSLKTQQDKNLSELITYYTLWVHQIKTPIAALDLLVQMEADTQNKRDKQLALFSIEQYVQMALQNIRLDAEFSDLMFSKMSLDSLVSQVVKKHKSLFIEKRLTLQMDVAAVEILTDEKWASVAIEQVLSNALKYTTQGTIHIYSKQGEPCTLFIEDTGMGISKEDLPRVFEKGYTGYNGRMIMRATGIGLYLTKRVCEKLGLEVQITSEVEKGTQVKLVFLPYKNVR